MNKFLSLLMVLVIMAGIIGCGAVKSEGSGAEPVGGYVNAENPEVSDELAAIVAEGTAKLGGAEYEPIALVSTQRVSGMNYKVLCTRKVSGQQRYEYVILTVYKPLEGEAEVTLIEGSEAEISGKEQAGGWTAAGAPGMTEEALAAFDTACANNIDVSYRALALVATQPVAGTNYCILCESTIEGAAPVTHYQLVCVYADLSGDAQITDAVSFIAE